MAEIDPETRTAEIKYDFVDKKSCDLVVLGGGGSGLVAAVRAAEISGKKVIVLEKDSTAGGGARAARTIRTFGSNWQAKRNIPDRTAAYAREMMDQTFWKLDEKLVSNCLLGTGRFFDWLCEQGGDIEDKFTPGRYVFAISENDPVGPQKADFGSFVMNMMKEKAETYGVEVLTKHPVVDIEVENGKVLAAIAKSDAGHVRIACRACILASGSWIRNDEIVKRYVPKYYEAIQYMKSKGGKGASQGRGDSKIGHTSPNYTGDGIALAEKADAFVDYDSFCIRPMGPLPETSVGGTVFRAMAQSPFIITVNLEGRRYCCEPVIMNLGLFNGGSVLMEQPGAQSWDIFDENTIDAALKYQKLPEGEKIPKKNVELAPDFEVSLPDTKEEIQEDLEKNSSSIIKADTLEELADKIGINKKNFLDTVKRYNQGCKTGIDGFFKNKTHLASINRPPYYAFKGVFGTNGAFGGVRVNPEMQVYKSDHISLVEGLYAAGDFASGRHVSVRGVKWQVINDLSWAFSSGFLAGTNVARYLKTLD